MTIVVLERAKPGLRGHLTRWMLEVRSGVFVGTVSSRVREYIWDVIEENLGAGSALLVWATSTEQGFAMRAIGDNSREIFDNEGLFLVRLRESSSLGDIAGQNPQ